MKLTVKNLQSKKVKDIDLPEAVFGYPYKEHLIHTVIQSYLAGLRRGTHSTKNRAEIVGSGGKLWRQKGTGRARVGDAKSPFVGVVVWHMVHGRAAMRTRSAPARRRTL